MLVTPGGVVVELHYLVPTLTKVPLVVKNDAQCVPLIVGNRKKVEGL